MSKHRDRSDLLWRLCDGLYYLGAVAVAMSLGTLLGVVIAP